MKPKSKAKQTKRNLVSPMSCYDKFIFTFIITNFSVMRSDFSVQMPNGAIIHGLVIEMRTMVDGSPRRSVVVVSEENRYGGFYEMIIDGFYSGNTVVYRQSPIFSCFQFCS